MDATPLTLIGVDISNWQVFIVPACAYFVARLCKIVVRWASQGWEESMRGLFYDDGGMPSVHTAFSVSLPAAFFFRDFALTDALLISSAFACIVMYDSVRVRYQSGLHARALNRLHNGEQPTTGTSIVTTFVENMGHTPAEVLGGAIVGIGVAAAIMFGL